ncbi:beta strand repeat-containing protein [Frondihabitans peucedani]|uniref:Bacterial Ig domain-containing protein n=1 Tax=Frondihabitans peucedani TaxID=598626 RepID=A0ABP8E020_9MICO
MPTHRISRRSPSFFSRHLLLRVGAATVVGAVIAASAIVPAQAATGDVSEAEGALLSGSGIVDLDTIAQLRSAYSATTATATQGTVSNPLDVTAVNALGVSLGNGVRLLGTNGLLTLGAAGQYANTTATGSTAASGVIGSDGTIAVGPGTPGSASTLNLTPLLSRVGASAAVASAAQLDIGALASRISATRGSAVGTSSSYAIAGADFAVTSPAIGGLNTSLQTTVNQVGSDLNDLTTNTSALNTVVSGTTGDLTTALNSLGLGVLSLNGTGLTVGLSGLNLGAVTAPVLARTYTSGPVTVTPSTGRIVIDLNTLQALNGQPANTQLLSTPALRSIVSAALQDILVTQLPAALDTAVVQAIGTATVTATLTARVAALGVNVGTLSVVSTTTLGNLLKTTGRAPLSVNARITPLGLGGLTVSSAVLTPALQPVVDGTLAPLLRGVFAPTVTGIPATLAAVTTPVGTTVSALPALLGQLVSITVNAQDSAGFQDDRGTTAGSRSVHALQLSILPGVNAATVDLATSTVNATTVAPLTIATPTADQQFTVATPTATRSITITGAGEPSASVAVDLGAGRTGTAVVGADGTWSTTIPGVGVGSVTASAVQTFGGVASPAVTRTFAVVAQQPLVITAPTANRTFTVVSPTATTAVTVSGTATPGAAIALDLGSGLTGTATADASGAWTTQVAGVGVGSYTISATQTSGGVTSPVATRPFTVVAGAALTVTAPTDGTRIVVPGQTGTTTVTVTGSAQPGATVRADLGGGLTGTTTAAADGSYSIPVAGVGVGDYSVRVTQSVGGSTSAPITRAITVVASAPLVIQAPVPGGQFRVAGPLSTTPVTVSGTAEKGASVTVQLADGVSRTVTADAVSGTWSATFPNLGVADYTATVTQTVAGVTSAPEDRAFSVVAADAVVITAPAAGTTSIVADPSSRRPVTVSGTAEPGASVDVVLDADHTATVTASGTGAWTTTFTGIPVGDYAIQATQTVGGTTSLPVTRPYSIQAGAPVAITAPTPGVDVVVASEGSTATVTVAGTAQPGAAIAIDLGDGLTATTTANASGAWSAQVTEVPIGDRTISVTETVGGTVSLAVTQPLTVAAGAPITIASPVSGKTVTVFGATGTTDVVVSGAAQPGASVRVSLGTGLSATTTASPTGAWSVSIPAVGIGTYSLSATQSINGSSSATAPQPFSVVQGGAIVIQQPADGTGYLVAESGSTRATTTVSGRASDGASVLVDLGGGRTRSTTATGGAWQVDFTDLPVGTYTVNATQTLQAASDDATPTSFSIRAGAPVDITAPVAGMEIRVATPDSAVPVAITGTAQPGADISVAVAGATLSTTTAGADGTWAVRTAGLTEGTYTASVTETIGGTTSTPVTRSFSVAAGAAFTVTAPLDGSVVDVADASGTQTIAVSGAGEIGATVQVALGATTKSTTVGLNGTWSTSFANVGVGPRTFRSVETLNGTTSAPIDRTVTIRAAAPVTVTAPTSTITVAGPAARIDVTVTGTAAPGAPVAIDLGSGLTATATADGTGVWTADFAQLPVGRYTIAASQTVNGTVSVPVTSDFTIVAGDPVVVLSPADGGRVTVADSAARVDLPVSGTAEANADISVDLGGGLTATTTAASDGRWSTTVADVPVGAYTVSVTQQVGGTTSDAVTSRVTVVPGAPLAITDPTADARIPVAAAGLTTDVAVTGTAQPGASIALSIAGAPRGTATADGSGEWTVTVADLGTGSYTASATQTVGGTTSGAVTRPFQVVVGAAVVIDSPSTGAVYPVARDTSTTSVTVTGTAEPRATVVAQLPGGIAATTTAADDGSYSLTLQDVPTGSQTISVKQTVNGTTSPTAATVTVTVRAAAPIVLSAPEPGVDVVVGAAGATATVPVAGTAEPGASVTIDLGGGLTATAQAGPTGSWSTVVEDVPVGDHTISVTQLVGGAPTMPVTQDLTVRVAAPVAIQSPADGSSLPVALIGGTRSVTAAGTAEPDTEVRVALDGGTPVVLRSSGAGAWTTTFTGVGIGDHEVTAREILNDGPTALVDAGFAVATADAATITTPRPDQVVQVAAGQTATVPVTGTGYPGASISVALDADQANARTTTVAGDGSWTTTFTRVPAGSHTAAVTQSVGGVDQAPVDVDFSVVVTADPAAPVVVTSPVRDAVLPDADGDGKVDVPVSGTGEPGSTITVDAGDGHTSTTTVGTGGDWSTTVADVPVGQITVVVTQETDGDTTGSDAVQITAVTIAPVTITAPAAGTPIVVSSPTATADVTVTGTGQPGATIAVDLGDGLTGTAQVGSDGTWSVTVDDVPVGDHTVSVVETSNGATLPAVTRDVTVAVAKPVAITSPRDGSAVTVPTASSTATLPVAGTAEPGVRVTVTLDGATPKTVTTGTDGTWSTSFPAVSPGAHTVEATEALADGATDPVSNDVTVRVATAAVITTPQPGQQFQVTSNTTTPVVVTGTGEPGARVAVTLDGANPRTVTVTAQGGWTTTFTGVGAGRHTVSATESIGGTSQAPTSVGFTVAVTADPAVGPTITSPANGQIIRDTDGDGTFDVPVTGTGEPGSTIRVDLGSGISRTTTVLSDGTWSTTVTSVPDGPRTIVVTQTTGGTTTGSASVQVTGSKAAPIVITSPTPGQVFAGGMTGTSAVPVSGTAEPGATVRLSLDGGAAKTATAAADGSWSILLTAVSRGDHTVTATETVGAATSAPVSTTFTVTGTVTGGALTVTSPRNGALLLDRDGNGSQDVTVTGTGTPGAAISVALDGGRTATATVGTAGTWSVVFPAVALGTHDYTATQVAITGTTTTAPRDFTVSGVAPVTVSSPRPGSVFTTGPEGTMWIPVSGTAEPGATVTVRLDDGRTETVTADARGRWSLRFPAVKPGDHVYVVHETVDGFASAPVSTSFLVLQGPASGTDGGDSGSGGTDGDGNGGTGGNGTGSGAPGNGSGTGTSAGSGIGVTAGGGATPTFVSGGALAFTGSTVLPWMVVGAGLFALGLGMVGASRGLSRIRASRR